MEWYEVARNGLITTVVGGLIGGLLGYITSKVNLKKAKVDETKKRQAALELGVQCLLRQQLVDAYYKYTEKEYMTMPVRDSLDRAYKAYNGLDGNDTVTSLWEEMKELPIK